MNNSNNATKSMTKKPRYDATEKVLISMMTENTGAHFLDSGGAYGRNYEANQKIRNFNDIPEVDMEVYKDEVSCTVNVYQYLRAFLRITPVTKKLQRQFDRLCSKPANETKGYNELMHEFMHQFEGCESYEITNTYNYDNLLSQVLQYGMFDLEGETYIILQIHGGCDVRGGYTKPKIFMVTENDYFHLAQTDINLDCGCTGMYSDDSGYHWYVGNPPEKTEMDKLLGTDISTEIPKNGLPKYWTFVESETEKNKLTCACCKKDVTARANLEY